MTVKELIDSNLFELVNAGEALDREIKKPFCCDLLSIAMGKATEGCAWVTVMGNMNTLAVASLQMRPALSWQREPPLTRRL